jgi:hypothetical protein
MGLNSAGERIATVSFGPTAITSPSRNAWENRYNLKTWAWIRLGYGYGLDTAWIRIRLGYGLDTDTAWIRLGYGLDTDTAWIRLGYGYGLFGYGYGSDTGYGYGSAWMRLGYGSAWMRLGYGLIDLATNHQFVSMCREKGKEVIIGDFLCSVPFVSHLFLLCVEYFVFCILYFVFHISYFV